MNQTKRFSIKNKLLAIFGLLVFAAIGLLGALATNIARKAVTEKVHTHLVDKASDTATIIDGRIEAFFQFAEGLARMPALLDANTPPREKTAFLVREAARDSNIRELAFIDNQGTYHGAGGKTIDLREREYVQRALDGHNFISEPYFSKTDNSLVITVSVPIYDDNRRVIGLIMCDISGLWLSEQIKDIVVGKTGACYILDRTGATVADEGKELVEKRANTSEEAKKNPALVSCGTFEQKALNSSAPGFGYYTYSGTAKVSAFSRLKVKDWTVIISAPVNEFMETIHTLRLEMIGIGVVILIAALVIVYLTARQIVQPIETTVNALQGIAQGDGDLTVRLPISGNDEITDLSLYFNQTIAKIGSAIKNVDDNSGVMQSIGDELSSNMTETASALNEISANIEGVKEQAMSQAASVTETADTVGTIIHTIEHLNESIESQSASVVQSSAAVEEMVSNIASITQSLEKSDGMVKMLATATSEGKTTLQNSNAVTQKIAEASGGLIEASSVIQNIASQTNLLAMNAAIEAAHAGEAGKGFAVVADEIRKLAEESSAQGKAITDTLKKLSDEIAGLSESSKTVEEKFNAIFQLSENVRGMSAELTAAMKEQENGSREVLAAIKTISSVTAEVKDGSEEMLTGGKGVAQEMQKLDRLTAEIKDSMNEMSAGVQQINNAVQEVNDLARKNKDSIEGLTSEVRKFKV